MPRPAVRAEEPRVSAPEVPPPVPEVTVDTPPILRVEVWRAGIQIGLLLPLHPPGVGALILLHDQVRKVLAREWHAKARVWRLEVT